MARGPLPGALLAVLLAGVLGCPPLWAASPGGMAREVFESVTRSPGARKAESASQTGGRMTGPAAPVAPVVPGAAAAKDAGAAQDAQGAGAVEGGKSLREELAQRDSGAASRVRTLSLAHGGARRAALVALPVRPGPGPLPAIIFLHGAGGSAAQAMRQTGLAARATAAGYAAVFPEGLGRQDPGGQTWNAWDCCGFARDGRVDDVGFLAALVSLLRAEWRVDPARIHLAGFSNGAMLAARFALERPGLAASLTCVAGALPCEAPRPVADLPVLVIHGDRDQVARFGPTPAHPATGRFCEDYPARAQAEFWARGMGLAAAPVRRESALVLEEDHAARGGGRGRVRLVVVKGGGHAWPGGPRERYRHCDLPVGGVDATGLLLEFIRQAGPLPGARAGAGKPPPPKAAKAATRR